MSKINKHLHDRPKLVLKEPIYHHKTVEIIPGLWVKSRSLADSDRQIRNEFKAKHPNVFKYSGL